MALKHYDGTPRPTLTAWNCPSCHTANTGPLEGGCVRCKAGGDGVKVGVPAAPLRSALDAVTEETAAVLTQPVRKATEEPWRVVYDKWRGEHEDADLYHAFKAGWDAALAQSLGEIRTPSVEAPVLVPVPEGAPAPVAGGWRLVMTKPHATDPAEIEHYADESTTATILAALAFYRDNQLAYGTIPGQLDAEGVTSLITQLTPAEPPPTTGQALADDDIVF